MEILYDLADCVTPVTPAVVNNARSFLVSWSGSKEGWPEMDAAWLRSKRCDEFVAWLRSKRYDDGSGPLMWVEVQYGGDDEEARVLRHAHDGREE